MAEKLWFTPSLVKLDGKDVPAQILDPLTRRPVPPYGKWVMANDYWYRRQGEGGGTLTAEQPPESKTLEAKMAAEAKEKEDAAKAEASAEAEPAAEHPAS